MEGRRCVFGARDRYRLKKEGGWSKGSLLGERRLVQCKDVRDSRAVRREQRGEMNESTSCVFTRSRGWPR